MTAPGRLMRSCQADAPHAPHWWPDPMTWAGGANIAVYDCPGRTEWPRSLLEAAEAKLAAVHALIEHARKISPSPSMHIYIADLERALGLDAPRPHKTGGNG